MLCHAERRVSNSSRADYIRSRGIRSTVMRSSMICSVLSLLDPDTPGIDMSDMAHAFLLLGYNHVNIHHPSAALPD